MLLLRRRVSVQRGPLARLLSTRASNILSALGLPTTGEVSGVYDGEWKGSGEVMLSICPTTGEELARVKSATPEELHATLEQTRKEYTQFRRESVTSSCHSLLTLQSRPCTTAWRNYQADSRSTGGEGKGMDM